MHSYGTKKTIPSFLIYVKNVFVSESKYCMLNTNVVSDAYSCYIEIYKIMIEYKNKKIQKTTTKETQQTTKQQHKNKIQHITLITFLKEPLISYA